MLKSMGDSCLKVFVFKFKSNLLSTVLRLIGDSCLQDLSKKTKYKYKQAEEQSAMNDVDVDR